jgi:hypothetical protein
MWDNRAMLHRRRPWDYRKERPMVRKIRARPIAPKLGTLLSATQLPAIGLTILVGATQGFRYLG